MVRTRSLRSIVLVAGFAILAAACTGGGEPASTQTQGGTTGGQPRSGGVMRLAAAVDVVTLDNSQAVSTIDYSLTAGALYEGLYHVDPDGTIVPALAADLPDVSDDGLTYTIAIRDGAMFAGPGFDARPVTAEDAAYGMERALDPNTKPGPSWGGGYLYGIEGAPAFASGDAKTVTGIQVVDPSTLRITLSAPASSFIYSLTIATSWPVPKEVVQADQEGFGNQPVGAGPFYLKSWDKGNRIVLAKNPGYADPTFPYLDGIEISLNVDPNTQALQLSDGTTDAATEPFFLPQAAIQQLRSDPNVTMTPTTGPTVYYWALNNQGVLKDRDVRIAVAQAISKDFVAQFGGVAEPWNQIYASVTNQSDPNVHVYQHDPNAAKAALQQAGYDGTPLKVIYDATDPYAEAMSTSLKQDLQAVGIPVDIKGLQQAAYFGSQGYNDPSNYDLLPTYWREDYPDGQDFISTNFVCAQVKPPGLNVARYCSQKVDSLLVKSDELPFGAKRDAVLREIQQQVIDDAAGVPMMQVDWPVITGRRVGALPTIPTYAPFDWKSAWLSGD
jgi:peptide/nickel transport system substrate-binding protein